MNNFIAARRLSFYPVGGYRWALLGLTVISMMLAAYEFQLAPVVPLLLPYLHLSHVGYGYFLTLTVVVSGVTAFYGGPLADRYSRVLIIDACLVVLTILAFLNVAIPPNGVVVFIVLRLAMSLIAALMFGALYAMARDLSPRVGRALAFGILAAGAVLTNWFANFIAGATLPIFHTWQSQFWIMGSIGAAASLPVFLWLKELDPEIRLQIYQSESTRLEAGTPSSTEVPTSTLGAYRDVLRHPPVWVPMVAFQGYLMVYYLIQAFGPLMFTELLHYSPAVAARMNANFWLLNVVTLIVAGFVSDRLQARKSMLMTAGALAAALMAWWIPRFSGGLSEGATEILSAALGGLLGIGAAPYLAMISETLEDLTPALQATGWAFSGLLARIVIGLSAPVTMIVIAHFGWLAWFKASLGGMIFFLVLMAFVPSRARAAVKAAAAAPASTG